MEFWKGYIQSKRELKQYLNRLDQDPSKLDELRDVFKEYVDLKKLLYRDGKDSNYKAIKAKAKAKASKKNEDLELYSLEEFSEMWLHNEVNKMAQKNKKEYENTSDDLDLDYYDSVPLHERYKWDGFSSSDEN